MEKIFSEKSGRKVKAGEHVIAEIDYIMSHDATTPLAIKSFRELEGFKVQGKKTVIMFDHVMPASTVQAANIQNEIREFVLENGIQRVFYGKGICHHLLIEEGIALPGRLVLGADSHTCTLGASGCLGIGAGSTDIAVAWGCGKNWFRVPESIRVNLNGRFGGEGVGAKDLALEVCRRLSASGATYKAIEYSGKAVSEMEMFERISVSNMSVECGAKAGLFPSDAVTKEFFEGRVGDEIVELSGDADAVYEKSEEIELGELDRLVAEPHEVDNVRGVSEVSGVKLNQVVIGSCTNGRIEDLREAAEILKGKSVSESVRLVVVPATVGEYRKALEEGLLEVFLDAGGIVMNPGCGPCLGRHSGVLGDGENCLATQNRNFCGRMGSPKANIYLGSPVTAALSAIEGVIV